MSPFQKRIILSLILLGVAIIAVIVSLNLTNPPPPAQVTVSFSMTLDPTIIANMTRIPQSTPLSGEDAEQFLRFVENVESCEDYADARRSQMLQHIEWLVNPATIPSDMFIALGQNPDQTLVFGMATYTSTQWRILERPEESCLIDIGHDINLLLEGLGGEPFTIYDETK